MFVKEKNIKEKIFDKRGDVLYNILTCAGDAMLLDLREIIGVPGCKVTFDYEPDLSDSVLGSVVRIKQPSRAAGDVVNHAGALTFSAIVDAVCICVCARCLKEFEYPVHQQVTAYLTEGGGRGRPG